MSQYYTGQVDMPSDGSAVPVCSVGPSGIIVSTSAQGQVYVGGSDVTPSTGLPIQSNNSTFIPGHGERPILYACEAPGQQNEKIAWMSTDPETAEVG